MNKSNTNRRRGRPAKPPLSVKLNVRIQPKLHRKLAIRAHQAGVPFETLIVRHLERALAQAETAYEPT